MKFSIAILLSILVSGCTSTHKEYLLANDNITLTGNLECLIVGENGCLVYGNRDLFSTYQHEQTVFQDKDGSITIREK